MKLLPMLPVIPLAANVPLRDDQEVMEGRIFASTAGQEQMKVKGMLAYVPIVWPERNRAMLREALKKFQSGEVRTLILPDDVTIVRA